MRFTAASEAVALDTASVAGHSLSSVPEDDIRVVQVDSLVHIAGMPALAPLKGLVDNMASEADNRVAADLVR